MTPAEQSETLNRLRTNVCTPPPAYEVALPPSSAVSAGPGPEAELHMHEGTGSSSEQILSQPDYSESNGEPRSPGLVAPPLPLPAPQLSDHDISVLRTARAMSEELGHLVEDSP